MPGIPFSASVLTQAEWAASEYPQTPHGLGSCRERISSRAHAERVFAKYLPAAGNQDGAAAGRSSRVKLRSKSFPTRISALS